MAGSPGSPYLILWFNYKKRSCPLLPFSASGFKSASRVSTPEIVDPHCLDYNVLITIVLATQVLFTQTVHVFAWSDIREIVPFFPFVPCESPFALSNAHAHTVFSAIFPFAWRNVTSAQPSEKLTWILTTNKFELKTKKLSKRLSERSECLMRLLLLYYLPNNFPVFLKPVKMNEASEVIGSDGGILLVQK